MYENQTPTQNLIGEHKGILRMLQILEVVAQKLKAGADLPQSHLQRIVDFLSGFADKCHHGKEEGILIPEMLKGKTDTRLVNEILGEHKTGRDLIRGMKESLVNYQPGNAEATHFSLNASDYILLLREHIRKEDEILFPLADKQFDPAFQKSLSERFEAWEKDVVGAGVHEKYHNWLSEFKQLYL